MVGRFFMTAVGLVSALAVALVYGAGGWLERQAKIALEDNE